VYKAHIENNIIAVGKHFPGHGEAWTDSHIDMPFIDMSLNNLESVHIRPFKHAIEKGLEAVMVAHVYYSAFNNEKIPASLSKELITDYLKNKLNFKGLIISDDMVMGGITKYYDQLEACIKAINAGIDILIFRDSSEQNIELIDKLHEAVQTGLISESRINESFEKILFFKSKYFISPPCPQGGKDRIGRIGRGQHRCNILKNLSDKYFSSWVILNRVKKQIIMLPKGDHPSHPEPCKESNNYSSEGDVKDLPAYSNRIDFNIKSQQEEIDKIALKSIKVFKKGKLIPLNKNANSKILILSPDKSQIFNYSKDKGRLSDFLNLNSCKEISYSLNPDEKEILNILDSCRQSDIVIFISYNALLNSGQMRLFEEIDVPLISIVAGNPYDVEKFHKADSILLSYCYKTPSLRALAKILGSSSVILNPNQFF